LALSAGPDRRTYCVIDDLVPDGTVGARRAGATTASGRFACAVSSVDSVMDLSSSMARPSEAAPLTAELPADLVFSARLYDFERALAGTCGHVGGPPPPAAPKFRFASEPAVPLRNGWSGHCLQIVERGAHDATPHENSGQVSKSPGLGALGALVRIGHWSDPARIGQGVEVTATRTQRRSRRSVLARGVARAAIPPVPRS
jgi:hypothetical protein